MLNPVPAGVEDPTGAQSHSAQTVGRRKRADGDSRPSVQTAQVAHSVLLPFLSALTEMDGRAAQRRETEASQEAAENGAAPTGGVAEATAVLQADQKAAEGSLERSTNALRRQSATSRQEQAQTPAPQSDGEDKGSKQQSHNADAKPAGDQRAEGRAPAPGATRAEPQANSQPPATQRPSAGGRQSPPQQIASPRAASPGATARPPQPPTAGPMAAPSAAPAVSAPPSQLSAAPAPSATKAESSAVRGANASASRGGPSAMQSTEGRPNAIRSPDAITESRRATDADRNASTAKATSGASTEKGKNDTNITQILRAIHSRIHDKNANVQMRLDPPSLGRIHISMQLQDRDMALRIDTETHLAQRMLSEKAELLREALQASGIHLERIEVRTQQPESAALRQDAPFDPQPQEADHRGGGGGRSETARGDRPADAGGAGEGDWPHDERTNEPTPDWTTGRPRGSIAERSLNVLA